MISIRRTRVRTSKPSVPSRSSALMLSEVSTHPAQQRMNAEMVKASKRPLPAWLDACLASSSGKQTSTAARATAKRNQ
jgi:hypothetical protein